MTKALDYFLGVVFIAALVLALALGWGMTHYRSVAGVMAIQLAQLQGDLQQQNDDAERLLAKRTQERDVVQAALDRSLKQQETTDAQAQQEIARLSGELDRRPVRVRIQPGACGPGGGSPEGDAATAADAGAADPAPTHGVLPAGNSARLGRVIAEIETLNAAYASCRNTLIQTNAALGGTP